MTGLAASQNGKVSLPFDLSDVVSNLREERYQRGRSSNRDSWTRFSAVRSLYYRLRPFLSISVRKRLQRIQLAGWESTTFPQWPVDVSVDRLVRNAVAEVLRNRGLSAVPFVWFWPDGASSCAMMTHDVEEPPGRDYCNPLMDLDEEFNIPSSFHVIPEGRYTGVTELVRGIKERGFEVNVHDLNHDGYLFRSAKEFFERVGCINGYGVQFGSRGFRAGVMYRNQEWFSALDFEYDMSVPSVSNLEPQQGGCCTVMPYFVGDILELPLTTIQDYTLFHILGDYSTRIWCDQMRRIEAWNGLMTFIAHPDYLIEERARAVYKQLLELLSQKRADGELWIASPAEVNQWWRDRRAMQLVCDGDSWRIEGPSSDRARVGYAVLRRGNDGDACDYSFAPVLSEAVSGR